MQKKTKKKVLEDAFILKLPLIREDDLKRKKNTL